MSTPLTSTFTARRDGIMTVEVGSITGEVDLETTADGDRVEHRVRYSGAHEWYRLEDAPTAGDPQSVHEALVDDLSGPAAATTDPPHGSQQGRDADDPAAGRFGGARGS